MRKPEKRKLLLLLVAIIIAIIIVTSGVFLSLGVPHQRNSTSASSTETSQTIQTSSSFVISESVSVSSESPTVSSSSSGGPNQASYVTSSAPNSSEWLVVISDTEPGVVVANNSGTIPAYSSLSELNATKIGTFCISENQAGTCLAFKMFRETGWYWDAQNKILYVHYVGGGAVRITIEGD